MMFSRFRRRTQRKPGRLLRRVLLWGLPVVALLGLAAYLVYLDKAIRDQFEDRRWALPAYVYARSLELFPGARLSADALEKELRLLAYQPLNGTLRPGSYQRHGDTVRVFTRPFTYWDGKEPASDVELQFNGGDLTMLTARNGGRNLDLARLDPVVIGRIYPAHHEDRVLVKLEQVPGLLRDGLQAVEDKNFYRHWGVDPQAVLRALWTNLREGEVVQGGSTLTQQLVKNIFLTNERTLVRKLNEALMAVLLDADYSKDEILEAYCNEIYLGQDNQRAIHGFGLASEFYFGQPLADLQPHQIALLIGLVKGPSYYDPRRHPQRASARRNVVLTVMEEAGLLTAEQAARARKQPLDVVARPAGVSNYPAFLDLVRRQLGRDYREEDLRSEGLRIFTTFDPLVQAAAEQAVSRRVTALEKQRGFKAGTLEGAVVVTNATGGEVLAAVGGRDPRFAGFNRVLDAERQIGSLVKPAVYLTALERPAKYSLITPLDDSPLEMKVPGGKLWRPQNYDKQFHGMVPLHTALAQSYNVPTVRLGMDVGVERVLETLRQLGIERKIDPYPAMLLGAMSLTPFEVTQMYQTIANGGFHTPLRAIREVVSVQGTPLQRYSLQLDQAVDAASIYLLTTAMQEVVITGTAQGLSSRLPAGLTVAGKTGTTDDLRDSWFAGFSGDRVAVAWVGRDDNAPAGFTGASGAMQVWGDLFAALETAPLALETPAGVEWVWIDPATGLLGQAGCEGARQWPFSAGSAPTELAPCAQGVEGTLQRSLDWLKGFFE